MKAYKLLVLNKNGKFPHSYSAYVHKIYKPDQVNKRTRGWGPMAVFEKLKQAINFLLMDMSYDIPFTGKLLIYEVEIKKSEDDRLWKPGGEVLKFLPYGTVLADEVTLVKLVKSIDYSKMQKMLAKMGSNEAKEDYIGDTIL